MKHCKFKYNKKQTLEGRKFIYPLGYDARLVGTITWCNSDCVDGDNLKEFVATVADDFPFGVNMVEITRAEVDTFVETSANNAPFKLSYNPETGAKITVEDKKQRFIANHKKAIDKDIAIACTCDDLIAFHAPNWNKPILDELGNVMLDDDGKPVDRQAATMDLTTLE